MSREIRIVNKMDRNFSIGFRPDPKQFAGMSDEDAKKKSLSQLMKAPGKNRVHIPAGASNTMDMDLLISLVQSNRALAAHFDEGRLETRSVEDNRVIEDLFGNSTKLEKPDELDTADKDVGNSSVDAAKVKSVEQAAIPAAPKGGPKAKK